MLEFERPLWDSGIEWIAGVDEAGRGPLAGPVVAAAVVFPSSVFTDRIRDSKRIPSRERDALHEWIRGNAASVGVGIVGPDRIDEINILQASFAAMREAVHRLSVVPQHLLVDGWPIPNHPIPQTGIVQGDTRSFCVAAASIVAKVTRDRIMIEYDRQYPQYGFGRHKGYGTRLHVRAIRRHGLCDLHRRSFRIPEW